MSLSIIFLHRILVGGERQVFLFLFYRWGNRGLEIVIHSLLVKRTIPNGAGIGFHGHMYSDWFSLKQSVNIILYIFGSLSSFRVLLSIFLISSIYTLHFPLIFIKPVLSKFLVSFLCNWIPLLSPQYLLKNRPPLKGTTFNVLSHSLILRLLEITLKGHRLCGIL